MRLLKLATLVVNSAFLADGLVAPVVWRPTRATGHLTALGESISQVQALRNNPEWQWVFQRFEGVGDEVIFAMDKGTLGRLFNDSRTEKALIKAFYNLLHHGSATATKVFTIVWDDPDEPPSTYKLSTEKSFIQVLRTRSVWGLERRNADGTWAGELILDWLLITDGATYRATSMHTRSRSLRGRLKHQDEEEDEVVKDEVNLAVQSHITRLLQNFMVDSVSARQKVVVDLDDQPELIAKYAKDFPELQRAWDLRQRGNRAERTYVVGEFDGIIYGNQAIIVNKAASHVTGEDLNAAADERALFLLYCELEGKPTPTLPVYTDLAGKTFPEACQELACRLGLLVLAPSGGNWRLRGEKVLKGRTPRDV
eukprot:TRINITY_DN14104_c0_g1_i2.p1 TRINITY_DN14104_c0_g1~~TRINITY_DN14104_c0_g1_i2.p1  ORF type:complete len:368 (-),score=75.93 TRINITY_DN14104_c0_g1_i2:288-1391(-)